MKQNFEQGALQVLEMLRREAPKMELCKAYDFVERYQEMADSLEKYEFIIMMLLKALGTNDNGNLKDKEIGLKLKDMPEEVWTALRLAGQVHGGYVCSPFTPKDWVVKANRKYRENMDVIPWKDNQLNVCLNLNTD